MSKRETIGQRLKRARLELGISAPQLKEKIERDYPPERGYTTIGETTIHDVEKDKIKNPGFKTLESIALGVGLDPLEVISLGLTDPPELESGYKASQFAQFARKYGTVKKTEKPFIDELIKILIEQMEKRR